MNTTSIDPVFSDALHHALTEHVTASATARAPRRRRMWWTVAAISSLGLVGAGAATAALTAPPGAPVIAVVGSPVTAEHSGTAAVPLGLIPDGATDVAVTVTCLTDGSFTFAKDAENSTGLGCSADSSPEQPLVRMPAFNGRDAVTIETTPEVRWKSTVTYTHVDHTDWAVNAAGETYGVTKENGEHPDLVSAVGRDDAGDEVQGFIRWTEAEGRTLGAAPSPTPADTASSRDTIPLYASDGRTPIGTFG